MLIEIDAKGESLLGMSPEEFLRDYWQKRPLLIRNAWPNIQPPIEPEDLAGLACEEMALSRLISHDPATDEWNVETGPFPEEKFPDMPDHDWTLLVQDVDKWDGDVAAMRDCFDFLPRWRIDDIMISFAATGGNVGAHVDHYDVFLIQTYGERNWQIDASESMGQGKPNLAFRNDVDIKLLQEFKATHDWVLKPGDMLYLPPEVPHHGVAVNPCLTYSLGMRAPSQADLISDFADDIASRLEEDQRYVDPDLHAAKDPFEIDGESIGRVRVAMKSLFDQDPASFANWFGRFITTYRNPGEIAPMDEQPTVKAIDVALQGGLELSRHPWSSMAWREDGDEAVVFFNGEEIRVSPEEARQLCATSVWNRSNWKALQNKGRDAIATLYARGQYALTEP